MNVKSVTSIESSKYFHQVNYHELYNNLKEMEDKMYQITYSNNLASNLQFLLLFAGLTLSAVFL